MIKLAGPYVRKYFDSNFEKGSRYSHYRPMELYQSRAQKQMEIAKDNVDKLGSMNFAVRAKRENVDLQLEAIYRQRLFDLNQAVKRRMVALFCVLNFCESLTMSVFVLTIQGLSHRMREHKTTISTKTHG